MKAKTIFLISLFSFFVFANLYSLDTLSCKYFPLHLGNIYFYKLIHTGSEGPPPVSYNDTTYKYSRITDIRIINNKLYYYCTNIPISGFLYNYYLRYDSTDGNLKKYDSSATSCDFERTLYDLSSNIYDSLGNYCISLINFDFQICDSISEVICFGFQTIKKSFYCNRSLGNSNSNCNIKLAKGFGTYYMASNSSYSAPGHSGSSHYYYFLLGAKINGTIYGDTNAPTSIRHINCELPSSFSLSQNYPNPFNPTTNIKYQIKESGIVTLKIFDILGKEIETLVNEKQSPGTYEVNWDAGKYSSGIYFCKLIYGDYSKTKKIILFK